MKIIFLDGTTGFYPQRLEEKPTGGILTSLTLVPRFLASKGMDVTVLSVCERAQVYKGVKYINKINGKTRYDVAVFNRNFFDAAGIKELNAKENWWWLHDVVDPRYLHDSSYRKMDRVIALSQYCLNSFSDYYQIDRNKFVIVPNGVDKSVFYPGTEDRDPNLYLLASAPIKGVFPVAYTCRNMKRLFPDWKLRVYSGKSLHEIDNTSRENKMFTDLAKEGAEMMDPIPQKELASVFRRAWALLMPNHYPEICSNVLLQAQACGLPVIATDIGSVGEFINDGESGYLTHTGPADLFWWWTDFARLCAQARMDVDLHAHISLHSPEFVASWDQVGGQWHELLTRQGVYA